ncbi:unnamed protein product [Cuscuta epithymum]|uniref:U3 small nucleolar ribonucleoprotein protein MPP10 n=1 Tax=Cuscuta epithymum TaxID=186058 RepID=A0AAV0GF96_9ASTE|nr:unnamed protein product [Cuscuta epithymum]
MENDGQVALLRLKSSEPPLYLSPSLDLSAAARLASRYLYSSLKPFTPKSPFPQLLTDGFDAEQIWQQIDLQSEPLISSIRRRVSYFKKNPESISEQFNVESKGLEKKIEPLEELDGNRDNIEDAVLDDFDEDDEEGEEEQQVDNEDDDEEKEEDSEEEEDDGTGLVEDEFLKIKELEKFMTDDEAREFGFEKEVKKKKRKRVEQSEPDDESAGDEDDGLGDVDFDDDISDEDADMENARYEDFFEKKKTDLNRKYKASNRSINMESDEERTDDGDDKGNHNLSTHERELLKLRSTIEEMEKANIEPKAWTMQGEVTAAKRPKNSALEVDLDFEHNVRPAPVITEEVTLSLEELIRKRILEEQFDDVKKPPSMPSRAPREKKELDDTKSKKGLAEVYEEEYVQKTGLVSNAMSFSDEQKKEASMLFKKLCLKLDALSHFHFAPKPVIEEMSIQTNVPALAMEEIAPVAISDAAMLAPEEVFTGKKDIKEETELTQEERKRRRAKKKRKFKAETSKKKAPLIALHTSSENKGQS